MTRAELEALAVRVETEEPGEDLRYAVLMAFGWKRRLGGAWKHTPSKKFANEPDPLHSLDAAVSLVPDGWRVLEVRQRLDGYWVCVLQNQHRTKIETGMAHTEPRARTAAALRARAQEASDE